MSPFRMLEVAIPRILFADILRLVSELQSPPGYIDSVKRSFVARPSQTHEERCAWMTTKPSFPALGAPMSLAWVHESAAELALPISAGSGNLGLNNKVIVPLAETVGLLRGALQIGIFADSSPGKLAVAAKQLVNKAVSGDLRAWKCLLEMMETHEWKRMNETIQQSVDGTAAREILEQRLAQISARMATTDSQDTDTPDKGFYR